MLDIFAACLAEPTIRIFVRLLISQELEGQVVAREKLEMESESGNIPSVVDI